MKKTELRKGNYVTCDLGGVLEIKRITEESCTGHLRPLIITKKWLLDFGFNKENDGAFTKNNICIFLNDKMKQNIFIKTSENQKEWFRIDLKIQYVHELQNLYFALTQTELTLS